MKKLFLLIFTIAFAAALTLNVAAAPSPTGTGIVQTITVVDNNNNVIVITMKDAPKSVVTAAQNENTLKTILGSAYQEGMKVVAAKDVTVPADTKFPVTITFDVKGVNANTQGAFMHWNGKEFEMVPAVFGNGTMTGTFNSLSPIIIVLDGSTAKAIEQVYGYDPSVDPKSPQTGIADMAWIYVVSTICLCGSVVAFSAGKKKSAVCC
jgi:hypothetical protein